MRPQLSVPRAVAARRSALLVLPYAVAALVVVVYLALFHDRLPDRLASHHSGDGRADGWTSASTYLTVSLALLLGMGVMFAAISVFSAVPRNTLRIFSALSWGTAGLLGYVLTGSLHANLDVKDPTQVTFPDTQLLIALGVAALPAGLIGWMLARFMGASHEPDTSATSVRHLELKPGEVASWSGTLRSRGLLLLGGLLAALALVLAAVGVHPAAWASQLVAALLVLACSGVRTTVDRRGLTVQTVPVFPLRRTIGLERIVEAGTREVSPMGEFGGWGYRVRPGKRGVLLRSGEALSVRLREGREFVVTVDDSRTGAALLNTLVQRQGGAGDPGKG
ncbi:DUF1648 domain-containing protein [Streptomyces sp. NPDC005438]|uniref:DUF1648 domain-containing protein n=1 Tax=Streptomyces sp. NPDC005438 TaxID=3156880 RepID=UPI0033A9975E